MVSLSEIGSMKEIKFCVPLQWLASHVLTDIYFLGYFLITRNLFGNYDHRRPPHPTKIKINLLGETFYTLTLNVPLLHIVCFSLSRTSLQAISSKGSSSAFFKSS